MRNNSIRIILTAVLISCSLLINGHSAEEHAITVGPGDKNNPIKFTPANPKDDPTWKLTVTAKPGYKHKGPFAPQQNNWKLVEVSDTVLEYTNKDLHDQYRNDGYTEIFSGTLEPINPVIARKPGKIDMEWEAQGKFYGDLLLEPSPLYVCKGKEASFIAKAQLADGQAEHEQVEVYWTVEGKKKHTETSNQLTLNENNGADIINNPDEYTITAKFGDLIASTKLYVTGLRIVKPIGSNGDNPIKEGSFIDDGKDLPYRYDWQGVCSSEQGETSVHDIEGEIIPSPPVGYKWTKVQHGTLVNLNSAKPTHTSPKNINGDKVEDILELKAVDENNDELECKDSRNIVIYRDHLQRDFVNFDGENSKTLIMKGGKHRLGFVCHDSTTHAYQGTPGCKDIWINNWGKGPSTIALGPGNNYPVPNLGQLERGDVIAYYNVKLNEDGTHEIKVDRPHHTQTVIDGPNKKTWGANNIPPVYVNGKRTNKRDGWIFATSPAGLHFKQFKQTKNVFPLLIQVYKKP